MSIATDRLKNARIALQQEIILDQKIVSTIPPPKDTEALVNAEAAAIEAETLKLKAIREGLSA